MQIADQSSYDVALEISRDWAGITAISPVSPAADKANAAHSKIAVALVSDDGSGSRTLPSPTGFP